MTQNETAYFAGGCFWCITPTFRELPGVSNVVSGYSGGDEKDPAYEDVKHQRTGHRETIRIDFDMEQVSFAKLMELFLSSVDLLTQTVSLSIGGTPTRWRYTTCPSSREILRNPRSNSLRKPPEAKSLSV